MCSRRCTRIDAVATHPPSPGPARPGPAQISFAVQPRLRLRPAGGGGGGRAARAGHERDVDHAPGRPARAAAPRRRPEYHRLGRAGRVTAGHHQAVVPAVPPVPALVARARRHRRPGEIEQLQPPRVRVRAVPPAAGAGGGEWRQGQPVVVGEPVRAGQPARGGRGRRGQLLDDGEAHGRVGGQLPAQQAEGPVRAARRRAGAGDGARAGGADGGGPEAVLEEDGRGGEEGGEAPCGDEGGVHVVDAVEGGDHAREGAAGAGGREDDGGAAERAVGGDDAAALGPEGEPAAGLEAVLEVEHVGVRRQLEDGVEQLCARGLDAAAEHQVVLEDPEVRASRLDSESYRSHVVQYDRQTQQPIFFRRPLQLHQSSIIYRAIRHQLLKVDVAGPGEWMNKSNIRKPTTFQESNRRVRSF